MQALDLLSIDGSWCMGSSVSFVDGVGSVSMSKRADVYG